MENEGLVKRIIKRGAGAGCQSLPGAEVNCSRQAFQDFVDDGLGSI